MAQYLQPLRSENSLEFNFGLAFSGTELLVEDASIRREAADRGFPPTPSNLEANLFCLGGRVPLWRHGCCRHKIIFERGLPQRKRDS